MIATVPFLRGGLARALALLAEHRHRLDALNVFPVPDADTGTNLWLTVAEACRAIEDIEDVEDDDGPATVAEEVARGLLLGARGSSGVIVAQYVGVLARALGDRRTVTGDALHGALTAAAAAGRAAVVRPAEGTVLTVADRVAVAVGDARAAGTSDVPGLLAAALREAEAAATRTTDQLDVLRRTGVQDAGAWGLVLLLAALHEVAGGPAWAGRVPDAATHATGRAGDTSHQVDHRGTVGGDLELMALVRPADEAAVVALREALAAVGDAVSTVGGAGLWQVHVHADDPAPVLRLLGDPGLAVDAVEVRDLRAPAGRAPALVVLTRSPGLVADLARCGAAVVLVRDPAGRGTGRAVPRALADAGEGAVVLDATGAGPVGTRTDLVEAHLVVAAAAAGLATSAAVGDVRRAVVRALDGTVGLDVDRVGADDEDVLVRTCRELVGESRSLLTLVTSADTPPRPVDAVVREVGTTAEVVVVAGGRPGDGVSLAVERVG